MKKISSFFKVYKKSNAGFTLIEIVVVLIVMGIIAAFVIGRGLSETPNLSVQADVIKSHLRHAQARATNSNTFWGIRSEGTSYWMFRCDSPTCGSPEIIRLPGEDADTVDLSTIGISFDAGTYSFDDRGIPYHIEAYTPPGNSLTSDLVVNVSKGTDISIVITKNTGFIP